MPVKTEDGGADWFLDVLAHPPEGPRRIVTYSSLLLSSVSREHISEKVIVIVTVQFSPVVLRLKVADGDESSSTADRKLVLQRRPLDEGGGPVDPEDDQRGLPHALLLGPHVGVTVGATRHYTVTFGSPVNTYTDGRRRNIDTKMI